MRKNRKMWMIEYFGYLFVYVNFVCSQPENFYSDDA